MSETRPVAPSGMTQASVRAKNLALVFGEVLTSSIAVSRADIAARLGMTRSTVSRLVDDLIMGGLIAEGEAMGGARGRPAVPLAVRKGSVFALGLEINVERIVSTLVDLTGDMVACYSHQVNTSELGLEASMGHLCELAGQTLNAVPPGARVAGALMAVPGLVDRKGHRIVRAPNLGWEGKEPREHWDVNFRGTPLPLMIRNDIDCSALTVLRESPGSSFLYVTGEVGVGASVSLDGNLLTGRHGWASEVGHICVDARGGLCGCGAVGCLETVAGSRAVLTATGQPDMDHVVRALEAGDERAHAAVAKVAEALGIALGAALNLLDVSSVRLGGHLGQLDAWLREPLLEQLTTRVLWAPDAGIELVVVERAPLRAAMGAGLAALGRVVWDPAGWVDPILQR